MITTNEKRLIPLHLLSTVVFAVITPFLAILIRGLGYSTLWVGIFLGIFEGAGIAGPFLLGHWADRTGNYRPALIVACILPALVAFPLIRWINPAATAILLTLMAIGLRSTTSLLDAITTIQTGKTGNYGRVRVWGSVSFILATLYLQWTPFLKPDSAVNISFWIIVTSVLYFAPTIFTSRLILKTSPEHHIDEAVTEKKTPVMPIYIIGGFVIIFLSRFAMVVIYTYFPLYLTEVLHWNVVGLMFALSAIAEIPFIFFSGRLIRRFGSLPLMGLSSVGICLRLLILAFLPFKPCIIAAQLLHCVCFGLFHPAAVHFVTSVFPARKRGTGMSLYMALGTGLPSLIGNMVGGAIVQVAGYQQLFVLYAAIAGASVIMCGWLSKKGEGIGTRD